MEKTFDPAAIESRVNDLWNEAEAFKAGRPDRQQAKPYTIVIPPPNVTGSLHMGHALNNTLQDILCRYHRMHGEDVLWQFGTDHAGIATQMVVERQLAERGEPTRRDMGREAFLERVWAWKEQSGGQIVQQLKRLGASCDWSRERFTMDEGLSRAVVKVFLSLYREGLIYKDKRLVNWDPQFQSAISDLEVVQIEKRGSLKWRRSEGEAFNPAALEKALKKDGAGHLYYFNYPLEGVTYNQDDATTFIQVATTRPETMLGDTMVAVHPEHPVLAGLVGRNVVLPLVGRKIAIIGDSYADPEKGSGAVKITPAHDFNDFEVGRHHNSAVINIFDVEARLALVGNEAFLKGVAPSAGLEAVLALNGISREEARLRIVHMMNAGGFLAKIEPTTHMVPHGDRSNVVIEPLLTDQWYVNAKVLAQPALAAVRQGKMRFIPKNWDKTYFEWLENIQPWCISRQLWWGHRIPAWYGPDGKIFVALDEAEAQAEADTHYGCPIALKRDEDVLDTWFSSALWPFSTLGWPDETAELKRHYPTNVLVTGFDIIFFWVARMMMMGLHFMQEVPFSDVYIHALVRDEKGSKMSKSKGNIIDPLTLIDQYGADSLRFTLAAMAAQGRDIKLSTTRVEGYRNFATKLWNAARFAEMNEALSPRAAFAPKNVRQVLNQWILSQQARVISQLSAAIESFRFNDAANSAYHFVWGVFCDWYLELAKPLLQGEDQVFVEETRATIAFCLQNIVKMLHPIMPFITEEIWAAQGNKGVLALAFWPNLAGLENSDADQEVGWLVELIQEIRSVRVEMGVPGGATTALLLVDASPQVNERADKWQAVLMRLARLSSIERVAQSPKGAAQILVRDSQAALPLADVIDLAAEEARLRKELTRLSGEMEKTQAKLNTADFVARAPEEVVEENRERIVEWTKRIEKLNNALQVLR